MIKREFRFVNFKTLGISKPLELELGAKSSKEKSFGGVLLLLGQNNAGKSNIISAIKSFGEKNIVIDQKPRHIIDSSILPQVKYVVKDEKHAYFVNATKGQFMIEASSETEKEIFKEDIVINTYKLSNDISKKAMAQLIHNFKSININNFRVERFGFPNIVIENLKLLHLLLSSTKTVEEMESIDFQKISEYLSNIPVSNLDRIMSERGYPVPNLNHIYSDLGYSKKDVNKQTAIKEYFNKSYNFELEPNIFYYDDKDVFTSRHLMTNVSNGKIQTPLFFEKMFDLLDNLNYEKVTNAYQSFYAGGQINKGPLYSIQKVLEKDIIKLSNQFNQIYTGNIDGQYKFDVDFESQRIDFIILENGQPVYYDDQSSGFKWFFNFFFNLIANKAMKAGTIVLMDEPATNLHVIGQIELRKLIKKYAIENDILFIISTHSPFFVDVDYLDEIRVCHKIERETMIENKFTHLNGNDIDTLLPIYSALTVGKHILLNPSSTLIFVEGITDYNYLCALKLMLGIEDINFLPIQGVGKQDQQEKIFKQLLKVTQNPIVLVDGDFAGKEFQKNNKYKAIEIISLKEIDGNFQTIESVFSKSDLDKNPLIANKVEPYLSSIEFKNEIEISKKKLTKKTIDNFLAIITYLKQ